MFMFSSIYSKKHKNRLTSTVPAEQPLATSAVTTVTALAASLANTRGRDPGPHSVTNEVSTERRSASLLRMQENQHVVIRIETESPLHLLVGELRVDWRQI